MSESPASLLRTAYRRLYWWPHDRRALRAVAGIRTVVAFGESLGDNLLCTQVLAGLHAAGAGPLAMATPYPELFAHLPFPVRCVPFSAPLLGALSRRGPRLIWPGYGRYDRAQDRHVPPPHDHLLVEMCRSAGLHGSVELKPLVVLTPEERARGLARASGHLLIQSSNAGARLPAANKEWPLERWQAVVDAWRGHAPIAQIGAASDPLLRGVVDLRGSLSLRDLAGALAAARLFVGGEGFLMHLARAVDCRAVIVLGGRTAARQTCYPENAILATAVPCAPCWQMNTCAHARICLDRITVAEVHAAIENQLAQPPLVGPGQRVPLA